MATVTIYAFSDSSDGRLYSSDNTYLTARAGGGTVQMNNVETSSPVGQYAYTPFYIDEIFMRFDTGSQIPDDATITAATLSCAWASLPGKTLSLEVWTRNWTAPLTVAQWVPGDDIAALTKVASRTVNPAVDVVNTRYNLTSETALLSAVNKTGLTYVMLATNEIRTGAEPTGSDYWDVWLEESAGRDPLLTVTYDTSPAPSGKYLAWRKT